MLAVDDAELRLLAVHGQEDTETFRSSKETPQWYARHNDRLCTCGQTILRG